MSVDLPRTFTFSFLLSFFCVWGQSFVRLDWGDRIPSRIRVKHFQLSYTPQIGDLPYNTIFPPDITRTTIENALPATNYSVVLQAILAGSSALSPLAPFVLLNNTVASSPDAPMIETLAINCTNITVDFFPPDGEGLSFYAEYYPTASGPNASRYLEFNSTRFILTRLRPYIHYTLQLKAVFRGIPSRYGANTTFYLDVNNTNCNDSIIPFAQPQDVDAIREGHKLRIEWDKPTDPNWGDYDCDTYRVNYTALTLRTPKSFFRSVPGNRQYVLVKLLRGHVLRLEVTCMVNDTLRSGEPGVGFADLREPDQPQNFRVVKSETDAFFNSSILLNYTWPPLHDYSKFPLIVSYYPAKAQKLRKDIHVQWPQAVNISSLKPSTSYTFLIRNVSSFGFESRPVRLQQVTRPIITSTVELVDKTTTALQLKITPTTNEEAKFSQYIVVFAVSPTVNTTKTRIPSELKEKRYEYNGLTPGQTYTVYLFTVYLSIRSRPIIAHFTTYPLAVKRTMPIVTRDLVKLYWEPEENNGRIRIQYKLSYSGSDGSELAPILLADQANYTFANLVPEVWFTFTIVVVMGETESTSETVTVVTGFNDAKVPLLRRVSAERLEIGIRPDFFTESNGEVVRYAVIVAEDFAMDRLPEKYRSHWEVQDQAVWAPYQATQDDWQPFSRQRDQERAFVIGSERCDGSRGYCNGPLKPDTTYYVKLRACTKEAVCMDTDYSKMRTDPSNRRALEIEFLNSSSLPFSSLLLLTLSLLFSLQL